MSSFFKQVGKQMSSLLTRREKPLFDVPTPSGKAERKRGKFRHRDPLLEERVSLLLSQVAPELCGMVTVGWNLRMRTTAGIAITSHREIWLNPALKSISEEEVERTLLHELAHLVAQHRHGRFRLSPHGSEWRKACRDLGIPDERRTHQLPFIGRRMRRRYRLRCPGCGDFHDRVRPPRRKIACLSCCRLHNGGRYDEVFRFEVTPLTEHSEALDSAA